jgi:hypothetical protein
MTTRVSTSASNKRDWVDVRLLSPLVPLLYFALFYPAAPVYQGSMSSFFGDDLLKLWWHREIGLRESFPRIDVLWLDKARSSERALLEAPFLAARGPVSCRRKPVLAKENRAGLDPIAIVEAVPRGDEAACR